MKTKKEDSIVKRYKEAFEQLENYDKTGKLELKSKYKKKLKKIIKGKHLFRKSLE